MDRNGPGPTGNQREDGLHRRLEGVDPPRQPVDLAIDNEHADARGVGSDGADHGRNGCEGLDHVKPSTTLPPASPSENPFSPTLQGRLLAAPTPETRKQPAPPGRRDRDDVDRLPAFQPHPHPDADDEQQDGGEDFNHAAKHSSAARPLPGLAR